MKILLLEPFYTSSHRQWADGIVKHSSHDITLKTLEGRHWKWRMHQAALSFAKMINEEQIAYDVILCTDMMDVAVFRGLLQVENWARKPKISLFFHENQITYPWSATDQDVALKRDNHYGWINFTSAYAADAIYFNSTFHKDSFLEALPTFLAQFPSDLPADAVLRIANKSSVIPLGFDMDELCNLSRTRRAVPTLLWNHRWEYDKNPEAFFKALFQLQKEELDFHVIIAGEKYKRYPTIFDEAKAKLGDKILHFGYAKSREEYLHLLAMSDILPVTSNQDFFGISAVEGIAAGCYPLLPSRLAFPEHLTEDIFSKYYYTTDIELADTLRSVINNWHSMAEDNTLRKYIRKYDWRTIIDVFDKTVALK